MEQLPEDVEDGPPELVYTHGGHNACVSDVSWNPETSTMPWMIASVSEDNLLQIWQPSKKAFESEEPGVQAAGDSDSDNDLE